MNKYFILILVIFCSSFGFSQQVESVYFFKREKKQTFKKHKISYVETKLDSLVLYTNGDFYRRVSYAQYDNFGFEEQKGKWKLENEQLHLKLQSKTNISSFNWVESSGDFSYQVRKNSLIPINYNAVRVFATEKLKAVR